MFISSRVKNSSKSITLESNEKVKNLIKDGRDIYNLTAGQLPFRPSSVFLESINAQMNFLASFQYSPVKGFSELNAKYWQKFLNDRSISDNDLDQLSDNKLASLVSNGSKHSIYNALGAIVEPGDEVIVFNPCWVSYPEMIQFWGGIAVKIPTLLYDSFHPDLESLEKYFTMNTRAIIINSPNNPAGVYYKESWMRSFAELMKKYPNIYIISDEIYSQISYFDPKPSYFYQYVPGLLSQTIIISGISKSHCSTGLRIGFCIARNEVIEAMSKIQSQTTSGPNSLIQRALIDFDESNLTELLSDINSHLRDCSEVLRMKMRQYELSHCWYQTNSAYYFMLDFTHTPYFKKHYSQLEASADFSAEICDSILNQIGVALIPGSGFGMPNSARLSLTLEINPFTEALDKLFAFLGQNS